METLKTLSLIQHISSTFQNLKSIHRTRLTITEEFIPKNLIRQAHTILQIINIIMYLPLINENCLIKEIEQTSRDVIQRRKYEHLTKTLLQSHKILNTPQLILSYYPHNIPENTSEQRSHIKLLLQETFSMLYIHTTYPNILEQLKTVQLLQNIPRKLHHLHITYNQLLTLRKSIEKTPPTNIPYLYSKIKPYIPSHLNTHMEHINTQMKTLQSISQYQRQIRKFQ